MPLNFTDRDFDGKFVLDMRLPEESLHFPNVYFAVSCTISLLLSDGTYSCYFQLQSG